MYGEIIALSNQIGVIGVKKIIFSIVILFLLIFVVTFNTDKSKIIRANIMYGNSEICEKREVTTNDYINRRCHLCLKKFKGSSSNILCYECSELTGRCDVCGRIKKNMSFNNIIITKYELGTDTKRNSIELTNARDIKKVEEFIKKLKPINNKQLAIAQEIEIKCGEFISIGIQLEERQYCYYEDKSQNISSISKMPDGLYEWIEEQSF